MKTLITSWIVLWASYLSLAALSPRDKAVTRPRANVTDLKVINNLVKNICITALFIPVTANIPTLDIFPHTIFGYVLKYLCTILLIDCWFYYGHRLMHSKRLYKWHSQHHEFTQSHALSALYCSWVEMLFVNQLSIAIPFQLFGFNNIEIVVASLLTAYNLVKGHGGLQLYNNVVTKNISHKWIDDEEHAAHHKLMDVNYGVMYIFDKLHGTYIENIKKRE